MQQTNQSALNRKLKDAERTDTHKGQAPVREGSDGHSIAADKESGHKKHYPKPSTADKQYKQQDEFIDRDNDDKSES
ncbi:hypothetical protein [Deminuibacter soli]|uniref:Uncharacterized protein n=1 Tax=Deminuibacter soli TaxID=2291815 RepID=A0A3E1NIZ0_9BACT|nr:hypothetical protein [Deminuibacter soli]RFM27748.1 hypothetical protein DXN05_13685 [Deminuibacter soli]